MNTKKELIEQNLLHVNESDVMIYSYPRSGNTWFRLMLTNIIRLHFSGAKAEDFLSSTISPTLEKHDFSKITRFENGFYLIKTHNGKRVEQRKFIYLFRRPEDALVSYYRFKQKRALGKGENGLSEFCLDEISKWKAHVNDALSKDNGFFVNYETLLDSTAVTLEKACQFLDFHPSQNVINEAIKKASIDSQREKFERKKMSQEIDFQLSSGKAGENRKLLPEDVMHKISESTKDVYQNALLMSENNHR